MYPGSRAADAYKNIYGRVSRITDVIFLERLSSFQAGGRKSTSETERRRMKNILSVLVYEPKFVDKALLNA